MRRKTQSKDLLLWEGWTFNDAGHLVKGAFVVPRALVPYLGQEREIRRYGNREWIDAETGYVWPEAALREGPPEGRGCSCGAKFTSLPQAHSEWCPRYVNGQLRKGD